MPKVRIIPRLDIKGPNVVKGIHTEGLRVIGDPALLAEKYYSEGADELIYMDTVASLYGRNVDLDLVRKVSDQIFIPLTVGGGVRTIHDIDNLLRAGADKVAINTHGIRNPQLLEEAVKHFGSQCIVLSVETKKKNSGSWEAYTDGGREQTGLDAIEWIKKGLLLGVGEILLTSVDRDGTRRGYETDLLAAVTSFASVPVIAYGGAGSLESVLDAIENAHIDAVSVASILHYNDVTIREIKSYLSKHDVSIRL